MKKTAILLTFLLALILAGCRANMPVSQQSGREDIAYLLFVSAGGEYNNKYVQVNVDGHQYDAKVVKAKKSNRKGMQYTAPTGNHQLIVTSEGRTLYSKKVFLSAQEVKNIQLP